MSKPTKSQAVFLKHLSKLGPARYSEYSRAYHIGDADFLPPTVMACLRRGWAFQVDGEVTLAEPGSAALIAGEGVRA